MIKAFALVVLGVAIFSLSSVASAGQEKWQTGTAISNHPERNSTLIGLRGSNGSLTLLTLHKGARITTGDGRVLQPSAIRSGDHLSVQGGSTVRDISQHVMTMRGIVSVAPLDKDDPIVLQISAALTIAVDPTAGARYSDRSHETSAVSQLQDADVLQIQGVYDSALGEMLQTDTIARLGPYRQKKHMSGTNG